MTALKALRALIWARRRALLGLACLGVLALMITQAAGSFAAFRAGQTTYAYFSEALSVGSAPYDYVRWRDETRTADRTRVLSDSADFTVYDARILGGRLSEAWRLFTLALQSGEETALSNVFSGPALARAEAAVMVESGAQMVTLHVDAAPQFFHLDRSLIQIEADNLIARFRLDAGGLHDFSLTQDATLTTLRVESTGWHIYAHKRQATQRLDRQSDQAVSPTAPLNGLNYYPSATPWRAFWEAFDAEIIAADLALIKGLGADSLRFFIPLEPFLRDRETRLEQLATFLALAQAAELDVVPTLFDLKGDYSPHTWPQDWAYLSAILTVLQNHGRVAFVDIKNEPDLDQRNFEPALIEAWLRTMVGLARHQAPELAFTIGWSSADAVALIDLVDVVTYHDYAPPRGTAQRLSGVQARSGGRTVLVTEIGETSWRGIPLIAGSSPQHQARRLKTRLAALAPADGVFLWTLHDFQSLDDQAIGGTFINKNRQMRFGLYDATGKEKPAAHVVREAFGAAP